jgi:ABC-type multidrug transport system permease subunit
MRFVWVSALKDLRILRRDPFSVATWVGIPLCIGLLMRLVFGGGGGAQPQGLLLIADRDQTIVSNLLAGAFSNDPLGKMLIVEKVEERTGRARIDRGDGSALLVIPQGLQDAFLNNRPYRLQLFTNAGQRILPKIVEESLSGMVDGSFYLQRVAGGELRGLDTGPTDADLIQRALQVRRLVEDMRKYLSPPLIQLETTVVAEKKKSAGTGDFFFPNMIFLSLLLMANGLSTDIWRERTSGTLRRLAVSPAPLAAFLAGRVAMVALVYGVVAIAAVTTAKYLAAVTVTNMAAAAGWAAISGTVFYLLLLPMAVYSSGQRGADVRGNLLVFPLAMAGGCFFPFEVMPDWLARIGRWTPNGLAVVQFKAVLQGAASPAHLAAVLAGLAALGFMAFLLTLRGLRGAFAQ